MHLCAHGSPVVAVLVAIGLSIGAGTAVTFKGTGEFKALQGSSVTVSASVAFEVTLQVASRFVVESSGSCTCTQPVTVEVCALACLAFLCNVMCMRVSAKMCSCCLLCIEPLYKLLGNHRPPCVCTCHWVCTRARAHEHVREREIVPA